MPSPNSTRVMLSTPPTRASAARRCAEHAGRLEGGDHAGRALHDGGEGRHMRIELAVEPDFARQIGVSEIADHDAPDAEVDRAVDLLRHRLDDGHRQARASRDSASGPSTATNGVRRPAASQIAPPLSGIGGSCLSARGFRLRAFVGRFVGDTRFGKCRHAGVAGERRAQDDAAPPRRRRLRRAAY